MIFRERISTRVSNGYAGILETVEEMFARMSAISVERPQVIGIGTPGVSDPQTGLMRNCNSTVLNGMPFLADVEHALKTPVVAANDANCFTLAEATLGSGRKAKCVFGVILGTGVGGGIAVRGDILAGAQGIAGEWGHNQLEADGKPCYCGKRGCVETVISGPALEQHYASLSGAQLSLSEISNRASLGSDHASATIDRLCEKFGEAISTVVNILDPDMIILGGGVGQVPALLERSQQETSKWVFNQNCRVRFAMPLLGDSAGVIGAAMLACARS